MKTAFTIKDIERVHNHASNEIKAIKTIIRGINKFKKADPGKDRSLCRIEILKWESLLEETTARASQILDDLRKARKAGGQ